MLKKYFRKWSQILTVMLSLGILFTGCSWMKEEEEEKLITIGFSQVGAESDWRTANSISIKETFSEENGYDLIFEDARQKQENQFMAIRSFIQQGVDYIIFAPVVEAGWDTVLEEAKRAGIPVIIMDRMIDVEDDSLYTSWVGSDFYLQGKKACTALEKYVELNQIREVNIVNIQGTLGATSQIGRTRALVEAAADYGWNLLEQQQGDYNSARAEEVMTEMLLKYDNINFVYCENDNEAIGAIAAIEAAGKKAGPGGDIQIISFDATKQGLYNTMSGQIIVNVECNPLQGPKIEQIIKELEAGQKPIKRNYISEEIFGYGNQLSEISINDAVFEVKEVTSELIIERQY